MPLITSLYRKDEDGENGRKKNHHHADVRRPTMADDFQDASRAEVSSAILTG